MVSFPLPMSLSWRMMRNPCPLSNSVTNIFCQTSLILLFFLEPPFVRLRKCANVLFRLRFCGFGRIRCSWPSKDCDRPETDSCSPFSRFPADREELADCILLYVIPWHYIVSCLCASTVIPETDCCWCHCSGGSPLQWEHLYSRIVEKQGQSGSQHSWPRYSSRRFTSIHHDRINMAGLIILGGWAGLIL